MTDSKETVVLDDVELREEEQANAVRGQILQYRRAYAKMLKDNTVALKKQFVNNIFDKLNLSRYKVK